MSMGPEYKGRVLVPGRMIEDAISRSLKVPEVSTWHQTPCHSVMVEGTDCSSALLAEVDIGIDSSL